MAIPLLTELGYLPRRIHDCYLQEVEALFVYNERRTHLWIGFTKIYRAITEVMLFERFFIAGSFVTLKPKPNDIDVAIQFKDAETLHVFYQRCELLRLHPSFLKRDFGVDLRLFHATSAYNFSEFFQYFDHDEAEKWPLPVGEKKGMLRLLVEEQRNV